MNSSTQHIPTPSSRMAVKWGKTTRRGQLLTRLLMATITIFALPLLAISCKKFVTVDAPTTSLVSGTVFTSNTTAAAAVTSIYSRLSAGGMATGANSISVTTGLAGDELKNYSANLLLSQFYTNRLVPSSTLNYWTEIYQHIYVTNSILEGLATPSAVTESMRNQLTGEAKFMRAFLHFYATNFFGSVPIVTSTDYRVNNAIDKSTPDQVYAQIINDLNDAKNLLGDKYVNAAGAATLDRIRPNKMAALAMLARVYLYAKQWPQAESAATEVLSKTSDYALVSDLTKVFLKQSKEAIWQLQPVVAGYNTWDAFYYVLTSTPGTGQFSTALSDRLVKKFEATDARLANWIGTYKNTTTNTTYNFAYKYKINAYNATAPVNELLMVLRLAELYLVRAEARAHQSNWSGVAEDLLAIRGRANVGLVAPTTLPDAQAAINRERELELFTEWGHRWLDLKRTGNIDAVMDTVATSKGTNWRTTDKLFPIPLNETLINPKLIQNDGYQ